MKTKSYPADYIGNTPLVRLEFIERYYELNFKLFAKLESRNPGGSIKDRAALFMLRDGEKRGLIRPGGVIVEPTSGNTGIALAMLGAAAGYRVAIYMPANMSPERIKSMRLYGAEVNLTAAAEGMNGAIKAAKERLSREEGGFMPGQFDNIAGVQAHFLTGEEIWRDSGGSVGVVVAGIGTGGTITGVSKFLKNKKNVLTIGVEPKESAVLSGKPKGPHGIQGIGAGFKPAILDLKAVDKLAAVASEEALKAAVFLCNNGVSAGISSGAALTAAISHKDLIGNRDTVLIFPDGGDRYLSLF